MLGALLLLALGLFAGAVLLLADGFGAVVVERVDVPERLGISREGWFTWGAVLLLVFCSVEAAPLRLFTVGRWTGVVERGVSEPAELRDLWPAAGVVFLFSSCL